MVGVQPNSHVRNKRGCPEGEQGRILASGPMRSRVSRASRCAEQAGRQAELQKAKTSQLQEMRVSTGVIADVCLDTARWCLYLLLRSAMDSRAVGN